LYGPANHIEPASVMLSKERLQFAREFRSLGVIQGVRST